MIAKYNKSVNLLDNFILHLLKKVINLSFIHMDQWYIRAINRLIINYDSSTFLFQNKIYKAKTKVDSICTYLYLYTYVYYLFVQKAANSLSCVYPHVSGNQPCNQSMVLQQLIHVFLLWFHICRERGRIRKGNCNCKL